jgi:hypothetical protein
MSTGTIGIVASELYSTTAVTTFVTKFALKHPGATVAVNGGRAANARIADEATAADLRVVAYAPDWDQHGRSAAYRRNEALVDACQYLVLFALADDARIDHVLHTALARGRTVFVYDHLDALVILDPDDFTPPGSQPNPPARALRSRPSAHPF